MDKSSTHTITIPVSSGEPLERTGWWGEKFEEELVHTAGAVDLTWADSGNAPVLRSHNSRDQIGVVKRAWLEAKEKRIMAEVEFSTANEAGKKAWDEIDSGMLRNVSIGWAYDDEDVEFIEKSEMGSNPRNLDFKVRFNKWRLEEVSMVAMPADKSVGIGRNDDSIRALRAVRSLDGRVANNIFALRNKQKQGRQTMQHPENQPTPEPTAPDPIRTEPAAPEPTPTPEPTPAPQPARTEPAGGPPAQEQSGYEAIRSRRANIRGLIGDAKTEELADRAVAENWDAARANEEVLAAMSGSNPAVRAPVRAPAVVGSRGDDATDYSIVNAVREAYAGRLKSGTGSLEAELHADAAKREGMRTLSENEHSLPISLLKRDKTFIRGILRANAERSTTATQANSLNAGMLTEDFDEFHLVEALYPRSGLFAKVRVFPQMLNQDLKVPVESGLADAAWTGTDDPETSDRSNTQTPTFPNDLEWSWKEVYAQFTITRKLIDQTAYLYDRINRCIQRDIPRRINRTLYYGAGSGGVPQGIINKTGVNSIVAPITGSGSTAAYQDLDWDTVISFMSEMEDANADYLGGAFYFANSKTVGKLMGTERFTGSNGMPILTKGMDGNGMIDGTSVIRDNHITSGNTSGTTTGVPLAAAGASAQANLSDMFYCIPQEIVLGYFSEMVMIVDPYSQKKQGQVEVQFRQAMDWQIEHAEAFSVCRTVRT